MHYSAMDEGEFISAATVDGRDVTLTIDRVEQRAVPKIGRPNDKEAKWVIVFREKSQVGTEKAWIVCKTNRKGLAVLFGPDTDGWVGQRVTLCAGSAKVKGHSVPAIRLRGCPTLARTVEYECGGERHRLVNTSKSEAAPPSPEPIESDPGSED